MQREVQVYSSKRDAEEADRTDYASLSPDERLDIALERTRRHREFPGEAAERFERVYRVVELSRR